MRTVRERVLIVAVFVALPLAALPGILPGPLASTYPALTLPSFAATPRNGGDLTITRPDVTVERSDGPAIDVPYAALLPAGSPNPIQVFRSTLGTAEQAADPSVAPWLRDRLDSILPGSQATAVTITWIRRCHRPDSTSCGVDVVSEFRVELADL